MQTSYPALGAFRYHLPARHPRHPYPHHRTQPQQATWHCSSCNYKANPASQILCVMCATHRDGSDSPDGGVGLATISPSFDTMVGEVMSEVGIEAVTGIYLGTLCCVNAGTRAMAPCTQRNRPAFTLPNYMYQTPCPSGSGVDRLGSMDDLGTGITLDEGPAPPGSTGD